MFDIHPTKTIKTSGKKGKTPLLSNTAINNGINDYCIEKAVETGNIITFSDTTESEKTIFYQDKPFIGFSHVQGMYPRIDNKWSQNASLFFISSFKQAIGNNYNYATKFNRTIAAEVLVELPIELDKNGNPVIDATHQYHNLGFIPNFHYMEERISELMEERISSLDAYLKVSGLVDYELSEEDKSIIYKKVNFKAFNISDLFEKCKVNSLKYKTHDLPKVKKDDYTLPALTAGIENQGLSCYVKRDRATILKNVISVSANGANTGAMFYQDEEFTILQDSYALKYKGNRPLNAEINLYMISAMQKIIKGNYDWSKKAGFERIKNIKISLPVNKLDNEKKLLVDAIIDFDYMEKYIKVLKKIIIEDVVKYKDNIIEETKKIVNNCKQ